MRQYKIIASRQLHYITQLIASMLYNDLTISAIYIGMILKSNNIREYNIRGIIF